MSARDQGICPKGKQNMSFGFMHLFWAIIAKCDNNVLHLLSGISLSMTFTGTVFDVLENVLSFSFLRVSKKEADLSFHNGSF